VAAREYTERQLAQAQGMIQDLRTRFHRVRQEKDAALSAAHSAIAAKDAAERNLKATEATTAAQRAARDRSDRTLHEAEATIRELRAKLATANQTLRTAQTERETEYQAKAGIVEITPATVTVEIAATIDSRGSVATKVRRPVGRPRKLVTAPPGQLSGIMDAANKRRPSVVKSEKAANQVKPGDSEPVQWWVPGWRDR
jgi:hypothetical protein